MNGWRDRPRDFAYAHGARKGKRMAGKSIDLGKITTIAKKSGSRIGEKLKKKYPLYETEPVADLRSLLAEAAANAGEKTAFRAGERTLTYGQLWADVQAVAAALEGLGIASSHLAFCDVGAADGFTFLLTVLCGSGVLLPLSGELSEDELLRRLRAGDAEALFAPAALLPVLREKAARLSGIRYFICNDLPRGEQDDRFLSYDRLLETGRTLLADGKAGTFAAADPGEPALLLFEDGREILLSGEALLFTLNGVLSLTAPCGSRLSVLPLSDPAELFCTLLPALREQATVERYAGDEGLLSAFRALRPESALLTPLQLEALYRAILLCFEEQGKGELLRSTLRKSDQLRRAGIDRRDELFESIREVFGGELRRIFCVSAPLRAEAGKFFDSIGIPVLLGWGVPETAGLAALQRDLQHDPESRGQLLPGYEAKILSPDESGSGEIALRGAGLMLGYYNDRKATREVLDDDGWLHTGEIGYFDGKGRLFVTGRKSSRILLKNGKTVCPEELEGLLLEIPYVEEARVSAAEETGLCAELFLREETVGELSESDRLKLMKREADDLNGSLPSYKQLRRVRIRKTPFPPKE